MEKIFKLAAKFAQQIEKQKDDAERGAMAGSLSWAKTFMWRAANAKGNDEVLKYFSRALGNMVEPWPFPPGMGLHNDIAKPLKDAAGYLSGAVKIIAGGPMSLEKKKKALNYTIYAYRIMKSYRWPIRNRSKLVAAMGKAISILKRGQTGPIVI